MSKLTTALPKESKENLQRTVKRLGGRLGPDAVLILILERMCAWHVMIGDFDAAIEISKTLIGMVQESPKSYDRIERLFPTTKDLS